MRDHYAPQQFRGKIILANMKHHRQWKWVRSVIVVPDVKVFVRNLPIWMHDPEVSRLIAFHTHYYVYIPIPGRMALLPQGWMLLEYGKKDEEGFQEFNCIHYRIPHWEGIDRPALRDEMKEIFYD